MFYNIKLRLNGVLESATHFLDLFIEQIFHRFSNFFWLSLEWSLR